jgi:hypothetical protein
MRFSRILLLLAGGLASMTAAAQPLVCPAAPAGRPCETFHYHVAMYRPDNRSFAEVYAAKSFATTTACERARELQLASNEKVVAFFRDVKEQQYPGDRIGACHCDMTAETASATYLSEQQRTMQLRTAEEIRLRVRERLLDHKVPGDSEIVRGLYFDPPATAALAFPKVLPPPQISASAVTTNAGDLRLTQTVDTGKAPVAAIDLPLVTPGAVLTAVAEPGDSAEPLPVAEVEAVSPIEETRVEAQPEVAESREPAGDAGDTDPETQSDGEEQSAEEIAESFVRYETQRIQNVLRASGTIADEAIKTSIFETAMERIQLLSNLRALIEGSGKDSLLSTAARSVQSEEDRVTLVSRLFGQSIRPHWAPKDAADVVFAIEPAIASAPERVLRDNSGTFTVEQKKNALYLVLAKTQPTEDQRLWLSSVVEGFLR